LRRNPATSFAFWTFLDFSLPFLEELRIMKRHRGSRGAAHPDAERSDPNLDPGPDPAAFARKLSELTGEPFDVDAAIEAARNLTAFFELLAEWDDAEKRREQE
jgi:hypothetical protein